jgi:hypothetical protein
VFSVKHSLHYDGLLSPRESLEPMAYVQPGPLFSFTPFECLVYVILLLTCKRGGEALVSPTLHTHRHSPSMASALARYHTLSSCSIAYILWSSHCLLLKGLSVVTSLQVLVHQFAVTTSFMLMYFFGMY